ncbi:30S ribosomal protein S10 [Candidatus Wolfebacteria bacterium]|nr:30S ribosomal protein S10 [Candidatus Wolfebacteria bacterium]
MAKKDIEKLRLKIKAYDHKLIDSSSRQIMDTAKRHDVEIIGPIPLPTETKKYTVNRSTFVHKDAREQFELRVHKRLIDILNPNNKIIESLSNLNLPAGVEIEIKMV